VAYHDELLEQALDLCHKDLLNPRQADLRRAVSAAYYALFHLLISETIVHWSLPGTRSTLGRMFEHSIMKRVSTKVIDQRFTGENPVVVEGLTQVAEAFVQLQQNRQLADYNNDKTWTATEALTEVESAEDAFATLRSILDERIVI
jgi:uncharacterized protein (UPF0332 family)